MDELSDSFVKTFSINVEPDDTNQNILPHDMLSTSSWDTVTSSEDKSDCSDDIISRSNTKVRFSLPNETIQRPNSSLCFYDNKAVKNNNIFRARPVPKYIKDNSLREKMLQEEEFRRIRIKIRAEEMLKSSVAPIPQRSTLRRSSSAHELHVHLQSPSQVPDFRSLHFKLAKDLGKNSHCASSTVCKPFNLTSSYGDLKNQNVEIIVDNQQVPHLKRVTSPIPARMTTASRLRDSSNRQKKESLEQSSTNKNEMTVSSMLTKQIIFDFKNFSAEKFKEKARELRKMHLARTKDYQNDLKEMRKRVQNQPLLVERQALESAKRKIERQFKVKLKECGVNESLVDKHSSYSKNFSSSRSVSSSVSNASSVNDLTFDQDLSVK